MRLTRKASSYFYSWLHQRFDYEPAYNAISSSEWFESLHPSMQWGIYQDWADSMGYEIGVTSSDIGFAVWFNDVWIETHKTRQEARNAAIERLNQLINEK